MPLFINAKDVKKAGSKVKPKLGKPVLPPKKSEMELRRKMTALWTEVLFPATERIQKLIKENAPIVQIADEIENTLRWANDHYSMVSHNLIDRWRASVDENTRGQMNRSIRQATGLDLNYVLDAPGVKEAMALGVYEATQLIKSIPGQHLGQIAKAVSDNYSGKPLPEGRSLIQQIQHIGHVSKDRAKLIARDQTNKMTGLLNQTRQQSIGIDEYIWRTVQDERVVGNPTGLYPKGNKTHGNHYEMEGVKCRWDDPTVYHNGKEWVKRTSTMPKSHPGSDIQCRCHAQPVINMQKLLALVEED